MNGDLTHTRFQLNSDRFAIDDFEDRTVLVDLEEGKYYAIWGDKGRAIFKAIYEGCTVDELMEAYGPYSFVSTDIMKANTKDYINLLNEIGVLGQRLDDTSIIPKPNSILYDHPQIEIYDQVMVNGSDHISNSQSINNASVLESELLDIISFSRLEFETLTYCFANTIVQIGYNHPDLKAFFHPVIQHVLTAKGDHPELFIHVCLVDEVCFGKARSLLESRDWHLQTASRFKKLVFWWDGILKVFNPISRQAYYLIKDINQIPAWESSFSFRDILNWHFEDSAIQFLHGAGVSLGECGVIISAVGGSGKSTTTMSAIFNSFKTVGDDFILVNSETNEMHMAYSVVKLRNDSFDLLSQCYSGDLKSISVYQKHNDKYHLNVFDHYPEQCTPKSRVSAVLIPKIGSEEPRIEPLEKREVLAEILVSTLYLLHGHKQKISAKIQAFIRRTPCFAFHLSTDLNRNVSVLRDFFTTLES